MFIKIDTRENDLMATMALLFKEHNHTINMEKMALGDIILIDKKKDEIENEKIIFERKSLYDLASSIKDGRYNEQSYRLTNYPIPNHNIIYLIEGNLSVWHNNYKVQANTLYTAIFSLNYYKGFSVIKTVDITETAEYLLRMCDKLNRENNKVSYYESG